MAETLLDSLNGFRGIAALARSVLEYSPGHEAFLRKSLLVHDDAEMPVLEELAVKILRLAGNDLAAFAASYLWLCDIFKEEHLFFVRHGRYRRSTFAEANEAVYSNAPFMKRYMEGLLVSQLLWHNHAMSYIFHARFLSSCPPGFRYLEIGPGHGLFLATVAASDKCASAEAWDVSPKSLTQTRNSLERLNVTRPVSLVKRDVQANRETKDKFDVIVVSEVLEHLETPARALATLHSCLAPNGRIFINFPVNSPAPDHIFLLDSLDAVIAFVEASGLVVEEARAFPATGYTLERAQTVRATVSCGIVARAGET